MSARTSTEDTAQNRRPGTVLRFAVPSLLGLLIFVAPIPDGSGAVTIPVALLAEGLQTLLQPALPWIAVAAMAVAGAGTLLWMIAHPRFMDHRWVRLLFDTTPVWCGIRVVGLTLGIVAVLELGPDWLWGADTAGLILDLVMIMFTVFFFAGLLLPLLLDFGLLEFAGVLLNKVMRPLFKVPGRSSVDALASWFGDATIGVLMTNQQYQKGLYTRREAAVLGTTFNVVSLTFTVVIMGMLGLQHQFLWFYLTIVIGGFVAAVIMPRIPPLSRIPDTYLVEEGTETTGAEAVAGASEPMGAVRGTFSRALTGALDRASQVRVAEVARRGATNVLEMWMGIIPVIMAVGTVAVIIAETTPLFEWLGYPLIPVLELMRVPEAEAASQTLLVGFADMLLPAVIGADITSEMTRFIIGCVSITQLIFMSEVGGLLLASKIPVRFHHLVAIFLLRTLITLPIVVAMAHVVY